MELTNTNRSRAYPDRLGMDVEKIRNEDFECSVLEGMKGNWYRSTPQVGPMRRVYSVAVARVW